jgi:hypothetical protein
MPYRIDRRTCALLRDANNICRKEYDLFQVLVPEDARRKSPDQNEKATRQLGQPFLKGE